MTNRSETEQDNRTIMRKLVVVAVLMFGFGWALVPLYRKICEVTGINILTDKDDGHQDQLQKVLYQPVDEVVFRERLWESGKR